MLSAVRPMEYYRTWMVESPEKVRIGFMISLFRRSDHHTSYVLL